MVRLSVNSIRVVSDNGKVADGVDATPVETLNMPDHVGAWLREARETTGRDLHDVAAHLRIRFPYLLAIEEGRFDDLPGRTYAVGFIRSYATHLGLDGEAMVVRFKTDAETVSVEQNLKFPTPAPEGRFPGSTALLVSAVLAAALIGGWYYYQDRGDISPDRVPPPPRAAAPASVAVTPAHPPAEAAVPRADAPAAATAEGRAGDPPVPAGGAASVGQPPQFEQMAANEPAATAPAGAPAVAPDSAAVPPAVPPAGSAPAMPAPDAPAAPIRHPAAPMAAPMADSAAGAAAATTAPPPPVAVVPEPVMPVAPAVLPTTAADAQAATAPAPQSATLPAVPAVALAAPGAGRAYGLSNRDARIVLSARGDSWVQVRDGDQNALLTRMLHDGDSYRVPNRAGLVLSVGNPSVLDVSIDDAAAFVLSNENVPISDIPLDPQRLNNGARFR